jgi:CRISPR/Cas system-associated protein Cas10 (large subunit of type III CRISPR-Cas system)
MTTDTICSYGVLCNHFKSCPSNAENLCSFCREERDQRRNDIEHLATSLVGKVNECVAALDEGARSITPFLFGTG